VTPIGRPYDRPSLRYDRHGVSRAQQVALRCLVCLCQPRCFLARPATDEDQVCEPCDKAWRRAGRPWGTGYEDFVRKRRAKYKRANPDEHLAALDIAAHRFALSVRAPMAEVVPLTREHPKDVDCEWDNGGASESRDASSF
jgi:hypothetical protein